jgi:hypothetical protein
MNSKQKILIAKPCEEDDRDSLQCSRIDKHDKVVPRTIKGKVFTAQLYKDMKWSLEGTYKMLGIMLKSKDTNEKIFVFELMNAEAYKRIHEPSTDDPKRRIRVEMPEPEHWKDSWGQTYKESQKPIVESFEGMPDGFVKITIPVLPFEKPVDDNTNDKEETEDGNK